VGIPDIAHIVRLSTAICSIFLYYGRKLNIPLSQPDPTYSALTNANQALPVIPDSSQRCLGKNSSHDSCLEASLPASTVEATEEIVKQMVQTRMAGSVGHPGCLSGAPIFEGVQDQNL